MPEITINTKFGTVKFEYQDDDDLDNSLPTIKQQISKVSDGFAQFIPKDQRSPKPGLDDAYGFTSDGLVELFEYPSSAIATVIFALYAYHPEMVPAESVEHTTGISNAVSKVLGQTKNKKYFRVEDGIYGLSREGIEYFKSNVEPNMVVTKIAPGEEGDS